MGLHKIIKIAAILLSIVGIIYFLMILMKGDETIIATGEGIDGYIYVAYIIVALAILFVLIFVIQGILAGNIMKTLIPIGAFLVIIAISYILADGTEMVMKDGGTLTAGQSRWIGAGLNTFYIVAVLAIGAMIFSGFKKVTR